MTEEPTFPAPADDHGVPDRHSARPRRARVAAICLGIVVIALIVALHLTGAITPGGH